MKHIKRWQEPLYGLGGFGPAFMYQVATSYLLTYYLPTDSQILSGAVMLAPAAMLGLVFWIARAIDGIIDIPIATWTDNLRSRWGRRRPLMLIGFLPMIAAYALMWFPPVTTGSSVANLIYVGLMSIVFFFCYTMSTVPYLSSLSELASDERSRTRIASWQTFFHTIGYSLAYVLVPMMFGWFGEQMTILILLPTMLTILVPIFIIKEQPTNGAGEKGVVEPHVPLIASLKLTMQNKPFRRYIYVYATLFLGLQLFLQGLRYMAHDMMGLNDQALGTMNAFAFAPIPVMLLIYNFANKRRGPKFSLRTALIAFSCSMVIFTLGWTGFGLPIPPIYLGMAAGIIGSFAIGVFFTVPYAIPSQIAAEEAAATGKNRAAMFFGVQGLINQVIGIGLSPLAVTLIRGIGSNGPVYIGPAVILVCLISFLLVSGMIASSKGKVSPDKAS